MRLPFVVLALVCVAAVPTPAPAAGRPTPAELATRIDAQLTRERDRAKVRPAPVVDDAAFLRRASLDLVGRIPTVAEVRAFLADAAADKRAKLVTGLIGTGGHVRHMATFWRRTWLPQADTGEYARLAEDFEGWLSTRLAENAPYDRTVRELLTAPYDADRPTTARNGFTPAGFFAANEGKPENLAGGTARAFLGVNLDCAQCHNHPFAKWTRDQFWQTAAFFAPPVRSGGRLVPPALAAPDTTKALAPALMDGTPVRWPPVLTSDSGREVLAGWVTGAGNPYFARNAVNRVWAQFFGSALVEPLDDVSTAADGTEPNAELLRDLAGAFAASGYDLKYLTRAIVLTETYQFSTATGDRAAVDPRLFARLPVRALTGEQLYDSLRTAAGLPLDTASGARKRFVARFRIERAVGAERSVGQTLALMNGPVTAELTAPSKNATVRGAADAPFLDAAGRVETLFLAVLGREPTEKERTPLVRYVSDGGTEKDAARALADVFWALVNTTEFGSNH
jgi:hypothetical protein